MATLDMVDKEDILDLWSAADDYDDDGPRNTTGRWWGKKLLAAY